ncbi:MAG: hypothetical protein CFK48_07895 [Armatimonadetes bacterium CP1_7O]|nr:MAG: hypothetical protein CFK48_07895 [Armatimonadetes bacterium CP1_7O]
MSRSRGSRGHSYEGESQNTLLTGVILLGGILFVIAAAWWFWNYSKSQAIQTPVMVGAGFDVSQSVSREQKLRGVAFLNKLVGTVLPTRTPIKIWRYAETMETIHQSRPIASKELNTVTRKMIENYMGTWGTRPDKVMQDFQRYLQQLPDRRAILCLFTDGECHSPQETRAIANQLAQDPQVVAVVVGPVLDKYRASVENDYYEPLNNAGKLLVFGETDAYDALDRLKERLKALDSKTQEN